LLKKIQFIDLLLFFYYSPLGGGHDPQNTVLLMKWRDRYLETLQHLDRNFSARGTNYRTIQEILSAPRREKPSKE